MARPAPLIAFTYAGGVNSWSHPRILALRDGREFFVKMRQHGRPVMDGAIFTECLASKLAYIIGAPVPSVEIIEVSHSLIAMNPDMAPMIAGLAHGSLTIPNVTNRNGILYTSLAENRRRFALFAVLYGWIGLGCDHQFFYEQTPPEVAYSYDHGFSFGQTQMLNHNLPWDAAQFIMCVPAVPDSIICSSCCLTSFEIQRAVDCLHQASDEAIAQAVSIPPDEWGVVLADRISVAMHLAVRRDFLLTLLP